MAFIEFGAESASSNTFVEFDLSAPAVAPKEQEVDWGKKLSASIDNYQAGLWAIPAAAGSEYALKAMQENKAAANQGFAEAGGPQSWDEMEFGENFGQYFGHLLVQSAPYMAEFAATGFGLGSLAKKGFSKSAETIAAKAAEEAVKRGATAEVAATVGNAAANGFFRTVGGVMGSYPSATGDVLSNQYEQAEEFNLPAAAALGVPYAALNAAGVEGMFMRGVSRGLPTIAKEVAGKGALPFAARAGITGAEVGLIEGATETGQEVLNQAGRMAVDPNATLTSDDAQARYKESFIAGGLMGGIPGAAVGGFRKGEVPQAKVDDILDPGKSLDESIATANEVINTGLIDAGNQSSEIDALLAQEAAQPANVIEQIQAVTPIAQADEGPMQAAMRLARERLQPQEPANVPLPADRTDADLAAPSPAQADRELPGSGDVLAPAPAGELESAIDRADVAAPGVRPAEDAGNAGSEGVVENAVPVSTDVFGTAASWVIRNKETGEVVMETFDRKKVEALNTAKYEAVPIQEYLTSLNAKQPIEQAQPLPDEQSANRPVTTAQLDAPAATTPDLPISSQIGTPAVNVETLPSGPTILRGDIDTVSPQLREAGIKFIPRNLDGVKVLQIAQSDAGRVQKMFEPEKPNVPSESVAPKGQPQVQVAAPTVPGAQSAQVEPARAEVAAAQAAEPTLLGKPISTVSDGTLKLAAKSKGPNQEAAAAELDRRTQAAAPSQQPPLYGKQSLEEFAATVKSEAVSAAQTRLTDLRRLQSGKLTPAERRTPVRQRLSPADIKTEIAVQETLIAEADERYSPEAVKPQYEALAAVGRVERPESPSAPDSQPKAIETGRQGVTLEQELSETRNPPEVSSPLAVGSTRFETKTLNGPKQILAKLYELPGYKGPQLAVATYKARTGQGYRIYLPKSGMLLQDNNGVGDLASTLKIAVQRISTAKSRLAENQPVSQPKPEVEAKPAQETPSVSPSAASKPIRMVKVGAFLEFYGDPQGVANVLGKTAAADHVAISTMTNVSKAMSSLKDAGYFVETVASRAEAKAPPATLTSEPAKVNRSGNGYAKINGYTITPNGEIGDQDFNIRHTKIGYLIHDENKQPLSFKTEQEAIAHAAQMPKDAPAVPAKGSATPEQSSAVDPRRGTMDDAQAKGFTIKAYRGVSKNKPFNDSGTVWLTTNKEAAESYATEIMGYDDPDVLTVMVNPDGLPVSDMRRISDEELDALEPDQFGNPQKLGIYHNSDDHILGGSHNATTIHAPMDAVFVIDGTRPRSPAQQSSAVDEVTKAKEILDAANVTGTDRTTTIAAVRRGDLTAEEVAEAHQPQKIEDFGEKLEGARKDAAPSLAKDFSDDDIATQPLSKIWPSDEVEKIEDKGAAAVAYATRAMIPAKPRTAYKVKRWVEQVKMLRGLARYITDETFTFDAFLDRMKEHRLADLASKIKLLNEIERTQWGRIGEVSEAPNAYAYENNEKVSRPMVGVRVDGKYHWLEGSGNVMDQLDKINALLGVEPAQKQMQFEVRGREGGPYSVNKKGDPERRQLKSFATTKEAFAFIKDHRDELVSAWESVKERDNVKETDVRGKENRPRAAEDYRQGKDVTPEQFGDTFGFRGVQFGNWVAQGAGRADRQGGLNAAYDALMDLANIIGVPPKALSLNGTLGLAFGARGSGAASAHYEPDTLVINLTKTRGAGTLAHEWFHALDNYFSHQRGGEIKMERGMSQEAYRQRNYITYRPEPMYVRKDGRGGMLSVAQLERFREENPKSMWFDADAWQKDPNHPNGVRPEVERSFAELVDALNASPMKVRASSIDKGENGYWSRIIERAARSFENYVIAKMMENGYHNDYLANVRPANDFARDKSRYPYLLPEEVAPIKEAFDNLFNTIETRETDKGVALYSRDRANIDTASRRMGKLIDEFAAGRMKDQDTQILGDTPTVLQALGADTLPLQIDGETVRKILDGKHRHTMSEDALRSLPDGIYNPLMVFDSPDTRTGAPGKLLVTEATDRTGNQIVALVHLSKKAGRLVVNDLASAYGLEDIGNRSKAAPEKLEYVRNEEGLATSTTPNLRKLAGVVQKARDLSVNILTEADIVKRFGTGYSRTESTPGTDASTVREWLAEPLAKLKNIPEVVIVQSQAEIPEVYDRLDSAIKAARAGDMKGLAELESFANRPVEGAYANGKIWIVADSMKSKERTLKVFAHEAVGHMAVEEMLDEADRLAGHAKPVTMPRLVKNVQLLDKAGNPYIRKLAKDVDRTQPGLNADQRAREIIAQIAERGDQGKDMGVVRSLWQKILDGIKAFYKLVFDQELSDQDVRDIVATAQRWAEGDEHVTAEIDGAMKSVSLSRGENAESLSPGERFWSKIRADEAFTDKELSDAFSIGRRGSARRGSPVQTVSGQVSQGVKGARAATTPFFWDESLAGFDGYYSIAKQSAGTGGPELLVSFVPQELFAQGVADSETSLLNSAVVSFRFTPEAGAYRIDVFDPEPQSAAYKALEAAGRLTKTDNLSEDGSHTYVQAKLDNRYSEARALMQEAVRRLALLEGDAPTVIEAGRDTGARAGTRESRIFGPDKIEAGFSRADDIALTSPRVTPPRNPSLDLQGGQGGKRSTWDLEPTTPWTDFVYKFQNKYVDLRDTLKAIRESGAKISDAFNTYLKEELYHKRVAKRTSDFFESEFKPLLITMQAMGVTREEFEQYLHARHAKEANALIRERGGMDDGGSGMTDQEADDYQAKVSPAKRKAYEALAKRTDAILAKTRDTLVDYGLESKETIDSWAKMFAHYVPLHREDMSEGQGIGQGFSVRGSASKHRTGSSKKVADILGNIAQQRDRAIVRGEKNRVAVSLYGLAMTNPNPDLWQVGKVPSMQTLDKNGQIVTMPDPLYKSRENVIVARLKDGQGNVHDRAVVFNEGDERAMRMAGALKNLDAASLEGLIGISAKITRFMAAMSTQYNPVFIFINFARDFQASAVNLSSTPLRGKQKEVAGHALSALRGIYSDLRDHRAGKVPASKWAQLYEEMQLEGGTTGYREMFATANDRTADQIERLLDPEWWAKTGWGKVVSANGLLKAPEQFLVSGPGKALFNWLSDANETAENAMRLAVYKTALDHGLSKEQAASLAKNISVNFNRKGQVGAQMNAAYSFYNAAAQGTARMAETLKGPAGKQIIGGGILMGVLQAVMMAAAGFDEDEPPEFVKERNLIIPLGWISGKKDYVSIPMPLGLHVLPGMGRISAELVLRGFRDPGKAAGDVVSMLAEAFNPIGSAGMSLQTIMPTPLDPLTALAENRDWTGKPIAKEDFNKNDPTPGHTRAKDTASWFGKAVSEGLNTVSGGSDYTPGWMSPTPDQIDYLVGQAGGGVMREYLKAEQTVSSSITGEDLPAHKVPLLGRVYGTTEGQSAEASRFYDNLRELNGHEREIKGRRENQGDVLGYLRENPEARLVRFANDVERKVAADRKLKRKLLEGGASKERIRLIEMRMASRMKSLNDRVEAVGR